MLFITNKEWIIMYIPNHQNTKWQTSKEIDLKKLLDKTKYKEDGMGGLICNGLMYVGYPR